MSIRAVIVLAIALLLIALGVFLLSSCGPVTFVDRRAIIHGDGNSIEYRADAETRVDHNTNAPPTTNDVTIPVIP